MGGRGRDAGLKPRQTTLNDAMRNIQIENVILESEKKRQSGLGTGNAGVGGPQTVKYKKCACCGEYTIPYGTELEVCPVCSWIDDPNQNQHPDSLEGMNQETLNEARRKYFGK